MQLKAKDALNYGTPCTCNNLTVKLPKHPPTFRHLMTPFECHDFSRFSGAVATMQKLSKYKSYLDKALFHKWSFRTAECRMTIHRTSYWSVSETQPPAPSTWSETLCLQVITFVFKCTIRCRFAKMPSIVQQNSSRSRRTISYTDMTHWYSEVY